MANEQTQSEMTAVEAAKLVFRTTPILDDKKQPTGKAERVAVKAGEVLAFRDYGDTVVVVTKDGQKFTGNKAGK